MKDTELVKIIYESTKRVNDKGEPVPETCPKCGEKIGVYLKGEPVFLCNGCKKYYGTMPFHPKESTKTEIEEFLLYKEACGSIDLDQVDMIMEKVTNYLG